MGLLHLFARCHLLLSHHKAWIMHRCVRQFLLYSEKVTFNSYRITDWMNLREKNSCAVIGILFSSQEMPSTEEEGAGMDLSSPLSVSLHQRHFLTDWWNAMHPQKQMESFVPSKPVFRQTAVTKPLPQRFTAHPKLMSTLWQIWWSLFLSYYLSGN